MADEEEEKVTLVDDGEVKPPRNPLLWEVELLMTEQKEDYDEDQDPEYGQEEGERWGQGAGS